MYTITAPDVAFFLKYFDVVDSKRSLDELKFTFMFQHLEPKTDGTSTICSAVEST